MPRFFFESRDGHVLESDEEGLHFADQTSAEVEAAKAAAAMLVDQLGRSNVSKVTVTIKDERGRPLANFTASLDIQRDLP